LEISGEFVTARDANVIGALAGSSSGAVLLTSHHDSVWNASGAIDNATGVEAVVRALESCADRVRAVGLTGIAFAAEELGLLGSRFAVAEAQVRGELDEVVAVVNFDSLGHGDQLLVQSTPGAMRRLVESAFEEVDFPPTVSPVHEDPGPGSDHLPYALQGVPVLSLMQFPYPEYHRPEESPDLVDDAAFQAGLTGATKVVEALLDGFDPRAGDRDD
jgi:Zn-dependent M28 family amino/carboxypeptidase